MLSHSAHLGGLSTLYSPWGPVPQYPEILLGRSVATSPDSQLLTGCLLFFRLLLCSAL